ncbi:phosphate acyltransferase PlsX [Halopseudomonas nanhaiensis]|uniref:phosphate acyltransferase PlsX n=1 Tax=Halopseudomonas nanhaiensis TaxID=2830842 RepID=UPI00226B51E8|nr:phosphate acyltransferase PlsX [Halopseudomonas nanhaiensis]UAX00039.1 phosphate acyltransferase PlsX [Halopseudomonas nanhaiensis]
MGGDFGPRCILPAVARSLATHPGLEVVLVGSAESMHEQSTLCPLPEKRVRWISASEVIHADDSPASVLRHKRDASMRLAIEQVRDGHADGCLSAGNTGALMVLARSILGTLEGVERPAIMASLPVSGRACHVLDMGANVDCTAMQLFEFAVMASETVRETSGLARPRIGLLNIGREVHKGSRMVREVSDMLRRSPELNYVGHIEGDGLFRDEADVVVCDGFVGNVVLKASEGLALYLQSELRQALAANRLLRLMSPVLRSALKPFGERHDPTRYNGASLLGLNGVVVKSHGAANQFAFEIAIERAMLACRAGLPTRIASKLAQCRAHL